jgi:hypothetical protein
MWIMAWSIVRLWLWVRVVLFVLLIARTWYNASIL